MSRELLFATIAAGGGHVATARAMAQAVHRLEPTRPTRVSDFMLELGFESEDRRHKETWRWMLARPRLVRAGQRVLDVLPPLVTAVQRRILDPLAQRAAEVLGRNPPALIVANHGFLAVALTRAQRRYGLTSPVVVFATEPFDANALWAEPDAERFVCASEAAKTHLVRLGVDASTIDVVGYPVQQAFLDAPTRAAARAALDLDSRFTCLVTLGGEGIVRDPRAVVQPLLDAGIQVVAVAGRNDALRQQLASLSGDRSDARLVVYGYTDRMPELIAAADVVVGKAGPASSMEALAVGRYLGITSFAGLNERAVLRFVQRSGLGAHLATRHEIAAAARRWSSDPEATDAELRSAEQRAASLGFRDMARDLAAYLLHYAETGHPPDRWTSRGLA